MAEARLHCPQLSLLLFGYALSSVYQASIYQDSSNVEPVLVISLWLWRFRNFVIVVQIPRCEPYRLRTLETMLQL